MLLSFLRHLRQLQFTQLQLNSYTKLKVIGLFLLIALTLLPHSFFNIFPFLENQEINTILFDAMHFPMFLFISHCTIPKDSNHFKLKACSILACILLVFAIEVIQFFTSRSASLIDILFGLLGMIAGYLITQLRNSGNINIYKQRIIGFFLGVTFLIWLGYCGMASFSLWSKYQSFPLLSDFSSSIQMNWWRNVNSQFKLVNNKLVVTKTESQQKYFGATYFNLQGVDFTEYKSLSFEIYTPNPISIEVRIDDKRIAPSYEERVNLSFPIQKGWQTIKVPTLNKAFRRINQSEATKITLFKSSDSFPDYFIIGRLSLIE